MKTMAGRPETEEELNKSLLDAVDLLENRADFDCRWFVFFGTMLGLYRDGTCIGGDDDIDIMVDCDMVKLGDLLRQEGYTTGIRNRDTILKTGKNSKKRFASVDYYHCLVEGNDWYSTWERTWIRDVEIEQIDFRGTKIYIPNRPEQRLAQMYGDTWQTPIKGVKVGRDKDIQ
jgi:phosphorylcholine metabolism protein LicD